jgi:tetratricopeptide (TPR) repeat protein
MVRVWDVEKQCELPFPGNPLLDGWNNLAFYPDSKHLAFVSYQRNLEVWNVPESQQTLTIGRPGEFGAQVIALSADGHWLATNPNESAITLWDAGTGERLVTFPEERAPIWSLAWSPDRRRLAVGLSDGGLVTWDLPRVRAELAALGLNWGEDSAPGSNPLQSSNPRESSGSGSAPALNEREIVLRFYTLGNAYLNSGQFDAAIVQFRSALSRDPSFAAARNNLGRALKSQGKLDEALQEFELTKQQLPKDPNIRYNIAFTLEDKGLYEEALAVL